MALYQQLKENQDVFGNSDIDKKLEAGQSGSPNKAEDKGEGEPQEEDPEEANDDLSIAWEALEVAKESYMKDGMVKHRGALAGERYLYIQSFLR